MSEVFLHCSECGHRLEFDFLCPRCGHDPSLEERTAMMKRRRDLEEKKKEKVCH